MLYINITSSSWKWPVFAIQTTTTIITSPYQSCQLTDGYTVNYVMVYLVPGSLSSVIQGYATSPPISSPWAVQLIYYYIIFMRASYTYIQGASVYIYIGASMHGTLYYNPGAWSCNNMLKGLIR